MSSPKATHNPAGGAPTVEPETESTSTAAEVAETTRKLRFDVMVAEYANLKAEQSKRIAYRDRTVYGSIAAAGVTVATATSHGIALLLLLPVVSLLLGWVYHVNDHLIGAAGRYLRHDVTVKLATLLGDGGEPVLGWETAHRSDALRRVRKVGQLVVDLVAFVGVPTGALIVFWLTGPRPTGLLVVSIAESVLLLGLAVMTILQADLTAHRDDTREVGR